MKGQIILVLLLGCLAIAFSLIATDRSKSRARKETVKNDE